MKYFTKYIPVEGEIKEGDDILLDGRPATVREIEGDISHMANVKKVKLFLCSTSFKVGDTVFNRYFSEFQHPNGHIITDKTDEMNCSMLSGGEPDASTYYEYPHGEWEYNHQTYKIIGEVSPQAMWVKEGMEFEEEDLFRKFFGGPGSAWPTGTVAFKCPTCSTFH